MTDAATIIEDEDVPEYLGIPLTEFSPDARKLLAHEQGWTPERWATHMGWDIETTEAVLIELVHHEVMEQIPCEGGKFEYLLYDDPFARGIFDA